jgi:hypothetical protein
VEVLQDMELTRTNRSGGLTTYFSERQGLVVQGLDVGATQTPRSVFEARREKVQVITSEIAFPESLSRLSRARGIV